MKITKIKKQNILKNNQTIETQKRNRINDPSSKMIINKRRSVSFSEKNILNETQIKKNISFDNSLELDYLNFSQMDLYKYNQSFEDDVFTPNNNKKRLVEERYQDSMSTMNDNSTINKNDIGNHNLDEQKLNTNDKNYIMNTPSTICNYYDQSTNKKINLNNNKYKINDEIKKNLSQYYNKSNENKENYSQNKNSINKKDEFVFSINCPNILLNNDKPTTKYLTQNLKSNSILNKNKYSKLSNVAKINRIKEIKASNSQNKVNKINQSNINQININKKYSKSNEKFQNKQINKTSLKNTKDEINNKEKTSMNPNQEKIKKQKPLNLCYNKNKFDAYFTTPRNMNKKNDVKNLSSNKNNKINVSNGPINKNKSFNNTKSNQSSIIKNNLIYLNNNEKNNPNKSNFKMFNDLINDLEINSKNYNKTTPKAKTKIKKEINSSKKDFIKVNLKNNTTNINNTKSSSNMAKTQKNFFTKNNNQIFYPFNQNSKLKSEIKQPFNIYKNISKKGNKNIFSPMNKNNPSFINYEAQKTLTEQNIMVNKMYKMQDATPKNYKIQKFESVPFTAMVKKIFVGSSKKDNLIRFDSSLKKKQNQKTKTEQMKCIFKPKTQSDLKNYDKIFGDYGNDKHVKQKLLDRMNKATNNWQYIFMGNKNKKLLNDGISNIKKNNRDKEHIDYFNKNDDIISDGSERED